MIIRILNLLQFGIKIMHNVLSNEKKVSICFSFINLSTESNVIF